MAIGANERRIIELVLKATGDRDIKKMAAEMTALRKTAQETQASMAGFASTVGNIGKFFAGLEVGRMIGEAMRFAIETIGEAVEEMDALASSIQKTGVAAADLQALQFAAQMSNVDIETLNKAMTKLAVNIADISGKGSPATQALREMGVTAGTSVSDAMIKVADQFAKMEDGAAKTAKAVQLFGKSGADMIPMLNEGSAGLAAMVEQAEQLGLILSGETLAGAQAFDDAMTTLGAVIDADVKKIVGGMAPALVTLTEMLLGATQQGVEFEDVGTSIGDMLIAITAEFAGAIAEMKAFADAITLTGDAASLTLQALQAGLTGNLAKADDLMVEAKAAADAAAYLYKNYEMIGNRVRGEVQGAYSATKARIKEAGGALDRGGSAAGDEGGTAASKAKARAAAAKEEEVVFRTMAETMADVNAQIIIYNQERQKSIDETQKDVDALERAANPMIAYAEGLKELNRLRDEGGLSAEAYRVELERLTQQMTEANVALRENSQAERERQKTEEEARKAMQEAEQKWGFVADAMAQATYDIITGTEKVGTAIKKMVATIIAEFLRMQAIKFVAGLISSAFGVPVASFASADGNAFGPSGIISVPTMHGARGGGIGIAGEAGPEAIMPLRRDAQGKLGIAGGAANVTVNNYARADVGVRETDRGLEIDVIERQLASRIRNGGSPVSSAFEQTYRVGRQASAS